MSFQQDYLLRMIQDLSALMTRVVRMRRQGDTEDAISLLADESSRMTGIPESLVYALSDEDLIGTLQARGAFEAERCYALAEIFREEGEIYQSRDQQIEASLRLTKAARLYTEALRHAEPESDFIKIDGLRDTLRHLSATNLSDTTLDPLLEVLMERSAYDLVDNVLFELLESPDDQIVYKARAEELYRQMLKASDYALSQVNLERSELEESLAALDDDLAWR